MNVSATPEPTASDSTLESPTDSSNAVDAVSAVAALDEPTRRRLYDYVSRQAGPVSREEAASALKLPRSTAAFHLDRLAERGLLDVTFERLTGRTGPGAGRPSKLYERAAESVSVSLPQRQYDLAGQLLASTIEESQRSGESPQSVLGRRAREHGTALSRGQSLPLQETLACCGYEPFEEGDDILLANCPFHEMAQAHVDLVCGMNLNLLQGVLEGMDEPGYAARLDPAPGRCCVRLSQVEASSP